ncbi:PREDICTED: probable glucan 1,3-beta-glucosidase A isoform X2 [Theobroma cacao]|uniref:Probable glucan 1,3-beta-glucosidase A isoform X2 n=1 Tax=Theobroma cacao TaxID=3641 RepID=A0AB32X224_THECC|nr:PREDICTED: probable glucan 1,3-beta-glucosidase A isoform X2 [Theobroma cacao]
MELVFRKWVFAFSLCCWLIFYVAFSVEGLHGDSKVTGVNLGGWLVIEGWIKPSLFDGIPNGDMLDGTQVQFKSVTLQKYVCAENGGGMDVSVNRDAASSWETFTLWRVSESEFQFRTTQGQFLTCYGTGCSVSATTKSASTTETFQIERNNNGRVHIKTKSGTYLQATIGNQLTADYPGTPGWNDNAATFEMSIVANNLHGDYQLANGYGHNKAKQVLERHRNTFINVGDFEFLFRQGINTVRIPVGWWIAFDPNPPAPFIGGTLEALDNAFSWAQAYNIKCIIDLHAAPGSQNGMEHSASQDGTTGWPTSSDYISQTLHVIDFLASRYAKHPALLGIELLNEPSAASVPLDTLVSYYKQGYEIVRKHSPSAYVVICQRIGNADPLELYQADIGSHNIVVDLHYYNLFDTFFVNKSAIDNIQFIYQSREAQLQALNGANGPLVFIGEWVNEWNVTSGSQSDYQDFGRAQLEVYDAASFGWAYWTLKNDRKHWDFEWNIRNNYLQLSNILNLSSLCFRRWTFRVLKSSNYSQLFCLTTIVLFLFYLCSEQHVTYIYAGNSQKEKIFNSLTWLLLASVCFHLCQIF